MEIVFFPKKKGLGMSLQAFPTYIGGENIFGKNLDHRNPYLGNRSTNLRIATYDAYGPQIIDPYPQKLIQEDSRATGRGRMLDILKKRVIVPTS